MLGTADPRSAPWRVLKLARGFALTLALTLVLATAAAPGLAAGPVRVGRHTSITRTLCEWESYFKGDWRTLRNRATTTTSYDRAENPPVVVAGVTFDLAASSPVETESEMVAVVRPGDPDLGEVRIKSKSRTAAGEVIKTAYTLRDKSSMSMPIAIGPMEGTAIRPPARQVKNGGKTFRIESVSRTVEITALLVVPTFADLIAGTGVSEVRDRGARLESGSLRVVSADGAQLGFYIGDVRVMRGEETVVAVGSDP